MAQIKCEACSKEFQVHESRIATARFCSRECFAANRKIRPIEERLFKWINKNGPIPAHKPELGPCWIWTGTKDRKGYGTLTVRQKSGLPAKCVRSHRVSYEVANGAIPEGESVLHHCDNPACNRPSHLFTGDQKANMEDAVAKGRVPKGEQRWNAKLTEKNVIEIKRLYSLGNCRMEDIAKKFKVTSSAIQRVIAGTDWKYLRVKNEQLTML